MEPTVNRTSAGSSTSAGQVPATVAAAAPVAKQHHVPCPVGTSAGSSTSAGQVPATVAAAAPVAKQHHVPCPVVTPGAKQPSKWLLKKLPSSLGTNLDSFMDAFADTDPEGNVTYTDFSKVVASNPEPMFEGRVGIPSMTYRKQPMTGEYATARMTALPLPANPRPVLRQSSKCTRARWVKKHRKLQDRKLMMVAVPVEAKQPVEAKEAVGQTFAKFGGYAADPGGVALPLRAKLLVKKDKCNICKESMRFEANLCVVIGCFHVYHQDCAFLPLACPYYPFKDTSERVQCESCLQDGAMFMFGDSDKAGDADVVDMTRDGDAVDTSKNGA